MGLTGLEPAAFELKAHCSTIELQTHRPFFGDAFDKGGA